MQITHATAHGWRKNVVDDALSLFGRSEQKKIKEALKKVFDSDISYSIKILDEDFLEWWFPMYENRVSTKDFPTVFDVREKTLGTLDRDREYFSLTLLEDNNRIGGLIFSIKGSTLFIAYRTFEYDWKKADLRCSPSLYVEYLMAEHAKKVGLKKISHGKDRNPYGLNSGIGLALFKLSVGCLPRLSSKNFTVETLDTNVLKKDALIFEYPKTDIPNAPISKIYLVADEEGKKKWSQIERFSDVLDIEVITRTTT